MTKKIRTKTSGGRVFNFKARDGGSIQDLTEREQLLADCEAPLSICLRKGSRVVLTWDIDKTLIKGSLGIVVAFMDDEKFNFYGDDEEWKEDADADENEDEAAKSQPDSSKDAEYLEHFPDSRRSIVKGPSDHGMRIWPLVRFAMPDGSTRDLLCQPEQWKVELPDGQVQAYRCQ
ncbi:MAG: hypothetical protein L6R35_003929 [Caloplaca aegaea]|nr:MAG: hypothetical protein L6R35_003929 [Caloplaca aegaea]